MLRSGVEISTTNNTQVVHGSQPLGSCRRQTVFQIAFGIKWCAFKRERYSLASSLVDHLRLGALMKCRHWLIECSLQGLLNCSTISARSCRQLLLEVNNFLLYVHVSMGVCMLTCQLHTEINSYHSQFVSILLLLRMTSRNFPKSFSWKESFRVNDFEIRPRRTSTFE